MEAYLISRFIIRSVGVVVACIIARSIYYDAKSRGMQDLGWAYGVFLMMIVFLPLYFIYRKPKLTKEEIDEKFRIQREATKQQQLEEITTNQAQGLVVSVAVLTWTLKLMSLVT